MRLRLCGGRLPVEALRAVAEVAEQHGDGRVHVTGRANLQLRAMPSTSAEQRLPDDVLVAIEATGLLPSRSHDLVRNIMVSPQSGIAGGRADLRPVAAALDAALCADPALGHLPGRFLFVLDDGRGDLLDRRGDLGLVALGRHRAQLRIGDSWGPVVRLSDAHRHLVGLAAQFLLARGHGPAAVWHVDELAVPLMGATPAASALPNRQAPLGFGPVAGGAHLPVPPQGLDRAAIERLCAAETDLVVTPWRGVLIPEETR